MAIISPGFFGRGPSDNAKLPPGQFLVRDWPVLTYGPTPQIETSDWSLSVTGEVSQTKTWSWAEFMKLPAETWTTDIHCVTRWSKLGTVWRGVWLDELFKISAPTDEAAFLLAKSYGDYSTNLPLSEVLNKQAMVAFEFDGKPLPREHGGPARLLVPHLYFWKSAKWVHELHLMSHDQLGFWEENGYHTHGDPWKEERYSGD